MIDIIGNGRTMVVSSSSLNDRVTSWMMSIVIIDNKFLFQTDLNSRKYNQLINNTNVSLCLDNIQINGEVWLIEKPCENARFVELFSKLYEGSYKAYSNLECERLFEVKPLRIERWIYKSVIPHIEYFDLVQNIYVNEPYFK